MMHVNQHVVFGEILISLLLITMISSSKELVITFFPKEKL